MKKIGVLALQGAFEEHITILSRLGATAVPVRLPSELEGLDGLIIPGGESTTISHLMQEYGLRGPIMQLIEDGLPVMGTCAGMILLARSVTDIDVETLGALDMEVKRNAFGRQVDSFEADLDIPAVGQTPFHGVFIRAPFIQRAGEGVSVLTRLSDGAGVAARGGNVLALAFHPELTDDPRMHSYFLTMTNGELEP